MTSEDLLAAPREPGPHLRHRGVVPHLSTIARPLQDEINRQLCRAVRDRPSAGPLGGDPLGVGRLVAGPVGAAPPAVDPCASAREAWGPWPGAALDRSRARR